MKTHVRGWSRSREAIARPRPTRLNLSAESSAESLPVLQFNLEPDSRLVMMRAIKKQS